MGSKSSYMPVCSLNKVDIICFVDLLRVTAFSRRLTINGDVWFIVVDYKTYFCAFSRRLAINKMSWLVSVECNVNACK